MPSPAGGLTRDPDPRREVRRRLVGPERPPEAEAVRMEIQLGRAASNRLIEGQTRCDRIGPAPGRPGTDTPRAAGSPPRPTAGPSRPGRRGRGGRSRPPPPTSGVVGSPNQAVVRRPRVVLEDLVRAYHHGLPHHDWASDSRVSLLVTLGVLPWFLRRSPRVRRTRSGSSATATPSMSGMRSRHRHPPASPVRAVLRGASDPPCVREM